MTAFLAPVVLPERGEWVRVYVGAFDDQGEARVALAELEADGVVAEGSGKIRLRIGVNLGDVISDGDDIYGDGVNIAARLQQAAHVVLHAVEVA
mgnify:CR=1 FL=1